MARTERKRRHLRDTALGFAVTGLLLAVQSGVAQADWREDFGTLRIGMVSPSGGRGIAGLEEMTTAFERATGVPVEILVARDFPALVRAQAENRVQYAVYSAVAYAAANALCQCVEPVAAPRGVDGAVGLRAVLIARRGPVETLADAAGARVVTGPAQGFGPQALALAALTQARTPTGAGSTFTAASQAEAEQVFREGKADVLVGWRPAYDDAEMVAQTGTPARLAASGMAPGETNIVWSSRILRYGPHAVRNDLPGELKERLSRFLVNLQDQQPDVYQFLEAYRGGGFSPASGADYSAAMAIIARFAPSGANR